MKLLLFFSGLIEKIISSKIFVLLSAVIFIRFAKNIFCTHHSENKEYLVVIYLGVYLIVQLIIVLLNKNAIPQSEKISYGIKLLFINIFLIIYINNDFKDVQYVNSIVGIGLLIDSLAQSLKLFAFSKELVALKDLPNSGVDLSVDEAKDVIRIFNPSYHYFYIKERGTKFEAIDKDTLKRLQDIYIAKKLVVDSRINLCKWHAYRKR